MKFFNFLRFANNGKKLSIIQKSPEQPHQVKKNPFLFLRN